MRDPDIFQPTVTLAPSPRSVHVAMQDLTLMIWRELFCKMGDLTPGFPTPGFPDPRVPSDMLSHIVSEFETEEQESSYNDWFCAKVQEALLSKKAPPATRCRHGQGSSHARRTPQYAG